MSAYRSQEEKDRREDERRRPWSRRAHLVARLGLIAPCLSIFAATFSLPLPEGIRVACGIPFVVAALISAAFAIGLFASQPAPGSSAKEALRYWASPLDDEGSVT